MDVVIDTNVLVSGLLCANSPPGEIVDLVFTNSITPVFDDRILFEYRDVLGRPKFAFPETVIEELIDALIVLGRQILTIHTQSVLPDEKDRCFFECTLSISSKTLITGNKKHFPSHRCPGIKVFSPSEFLKVI
jgi:putative PIN family toxin of toxin-antitoxin system